MLVALAFRQVFFSKIPKRLEELRHYLLLLKQYYSLVLPGNEGVGKVSVMLTFDFASIDFYEHIFPFLHEYQIPALVGVAWRYVASKETEQLAFEERISPMETLAFQDEIFTNYGPFCSQKELRIMAASPYIQLASSGFAIRNLTRSPPYLATEVFLSRHCIEVATGRRPLAFLYPFGKYDYASSKYVRTQYAYSFVLGNTINLGYKHHEMYRLDMTKGQYHLPSLTRGGAYLTAWIRDRVKVCLSSSLPTI